MLNIIKGNEVYKISIINEIKSKPILYYKKVSKQDLLTIFKGWLNVKDSDNKYDYFYEIFLILIPVAKEKK